MIRDATEADAAAIAAIYAPYVRDTAATFELEPPPALEIAARIAQAQARHAYLVAEQDGEVVGYAYAGALRPRPAYDRSCESSVYLRQGLRRSGTGRALMEALLERLRQRGLHAVIAGVVPPNEASVGLHRALGFVDAGVWKQVGFKHDRWWDVAWFQMTLG
ncbi:GNAT family N-acetyltransferase [uncultured Amnibacterium sp.]|uniref:GNAT family N-acetyltransferase n=1 Tax=uncultured Amnibacterium sp. TaxID=1631851 RepID=UPI0035CB1BD7